MSRINTLSIILFYFILLSTSSIVVAQTEYNDKNNISLETELPWKKWQKTNTLSVSYRPTKNASLIEIKASATVKSNIAGFLLFIQDVENTPKWLANATSSKVLEQISIDENIFTVNFSGFLFVKPRKIIVRSHYWQNNDLSVEISVQSENILNQNNDNDSKNTVIAHIHSAHWVLTPFIDKSNQKQLNIEYSFIADSGGDMPEWLTQHMALKLIWKTMKNIMRQLPKSHWQQKSLSNIKELP